MLGALLVTTVVLVVILVYLLGFRLGADERNHELIEVQLEARKAERQLNELTRQAFIAMAEHSMHRRRAREHQRGTDDGG